MIKTSVIITSYNNSHNLEKCLKSLIEQDYNRDHIDAEIIVVDSGSTDNSIEILEKHRNEIKTILKPQNYSRLSPAIARNIGVQNSKGDILILSDSDCVLPKNWIKEIVASFENREVDCVIGNRDPDIGQGLGAFIRKYDFILYSNKFRISKPIIINKNSLQTGTPLVLISANNFAIKKEIWNRFGGMKTIFTHPAGEDVMLEIEIIKAGYNILFNPYIKNSHIHPISLGALFNKFSHNGEATYLLRKYSNKFLDWKYFAERGHILDIRKFFLGTIFFILLLLTLASFRIPLSIIIITLSGVFLMTFFYNLFQLKKRLRLILNAKEEEYKDLYKPSLFQLFYFNQIHFLLKGTALISFLRCFLVKK